MKYGEAFPSKWLASSDIPDEGLVVTVASYSFEEIGQDKDKKPVLHFRERGIKSLVLNKTNAKTITEVTGSDDLDDWADHKITLIAKEVEFQGDTVWAIRVQKPRRQTRAGQTSAQAARATADGPRFDADREPPDDDIGR